MAGYDGAEVGKVFGNAKAFTKIEVTEAGQKAPAPRAAPRTRPAQALRVPAQVRVGAQEPARRMDSNTARLFAWERDLLHRLLPCDRAGERPRQDRRAHAVRRRQEISRRIAQEKEAGVDAKR